MSTLSDDKVFSFAESELLVAANRLLQKKCITKYQLDHDQFRFILWRKGDNKQLSLDISPTGEVFTRIFDEGYSHTTVAYTDQEKIEAIEDFKEDMNIFLDTKSYQEEVYTQNKKVVFRKIIFNNGATETYSSVPFGTLRKLFSSKREIRHP